MVAEQPVVSRTQALTRRQGIRAAGGLAAAAIAVGFPRIAGAQSSTPTSGGSETNPEIGTAVPYFNVEGVTIGEITVTSLTDPFSGYRSNAPPPRGSRFATLGLSVENTSDVPWSFDPGRVYLQDDQGFLLYPASVDLGEEPVEPGIAYQDIVPGPAVTGVIGYVVVKGVTPIRVFFSPANDRLILLADLRGS